MASLLNKLKSTRLRLVALGSAALLIAMALFLAVRLNREITEKSEELSAESRIEVEETQLRAPATAGISVYVNAADARATAVYAGTRYLATSGGLFALDDSGNVKRRYTTLDGLPENDLTALAVFRNRLFIGTASRGLVAFDGETFTGYGFVKPKASRVSALVQTESELLIGTLDAGLFEYDGERFSRRLNSAAGADFSRVTALLPLASRFYIGTQDRGLYIWREGRVERIGTNEGLASPHVTGLAALPPKLSGAGQVAVATDFGVWGLSDANELKPLSGRPNVTSLAVAGGRLWAGLFGGGVVELGGDRAADQAEGSRAGPGVAGLPPAAPAIVSASEGDLWALTREGAYFREATAAGPGFQAVAGSQAGRSLLASDHITGLAFDGAGRLWVGYFDRGIDILEREANERQSHIEDDRVREVNFLRFDTRYDRIVVATSRGLVTFDPRLKQAILTQERNGLVNDSIAHVSFNEFSGAPQVAGAFDGGQSMVLATAGGLTEVRGGRARSLTAFHGLASNHLYTSAFVGSRLFVGSLAGLVELEGLRVVRTYKTSNSRLGHDWVTALAEADGALYIGTNGGGVDALLATGEWLSFADEVGRFEVNQNAMHFDGERLYVGTADRGLLVYNAAARRWTRISGPLTSQSVTAIASDTQFVYVGTLNGLVRIEKRVIE